MREDYSVASDLQSVATYCKDLQIANNAPAVMVCLLMALALLSTAFGQHPGRDTAVCNYNHAFQSKGLIAPATLLTAGSTITAVPLLQKNINVAVRDWVQDFNPRRVYFDNYLQYVPLASVVALKGLGVKSEHVWRDLVCLTGASCAIGFSLSTLVKHTACVGRPGNPEERTSFPSGHTTTAFLGAELLRREYGREYPAIAVAGYTVAAGVACMRVWNNRHWVADLLGGAGMSILSVGIAYWLAPYLRF